MSIRTLQTTEHNGLEVSEIEINGAYGRNVRWDTFCPTCDDFIAVGVTEDEAFEVADQHRHDDQAEV